MSTAKCRWWLRIPTPRGRGATRTVYPTRGWRIHQKVTLVIRWEAPVERSDLRQKPEHREEIQQNRKPNETAGICANHENASRIVEKMNQHLCHKL